MTTDAATLLTSHKNVATMDSEQQFLLLQLRALKDTQRALGREIGRIERRLMDLQRTAA